ncbi:MAG: hypothetical protein QS748_13925 [Candidatus Endonucleobacter bathymodioli]|uniref:Uncharacterized protein n=1 Tax=Candidatus Endonucleibacter bathymodioli TaxID=539814 RepID=A0AA90SE82_9GAMM|nr:hypothetical protein [Candidatus Endonucleobacter bathymodioli]
MISEKKQVRTVLEERIKQFKAWSERKPAAVEGLCIRKFPCKVELLSFVVSDGRQPAAQAKLKVIFVNQRQLWSADMTLSIFTRTVRKPGYEDLKSGIYFHAPADSGEKPTLLNSYKIIMDLKGAYEPADFNEWYFYWLQRMLKSPEIKGLFAHKQLFSDNEIEAQLYTQEVLKQL